MDARILFPEVGEEEDEVDNVDALETATGRGDLGDHLDGGHLCVEDDLILEGSKPCLVGEGEEVVTRAALDGALAGLVPRPHRLGFFIGSKSGVVDQDGCVVVGVCGELSAVQHGRRARGLILCIR